MNSLTSLILLVSWIAGFVLAKGFFSTVFCFFPIWAYYLVVEYLLLRYV